MCGICGIFNMESDRPIGTHKIESMMDSTRHRGPDDEGSYFADHVAFGFRRLSIIDLKTGHQPIFNEDGSMAIICNGEIYNHKDLRLELIRSGHQFNTKSDVEAILHGYEEYGIDVVKHLRGMFAFALWDNKQKRLFLARDRLGKKPLYYSIAGGRFIFASEIKTILASHEIAPALNEQTLSHFLTLMYSPGEMTLFKGIKKLLPGYMMVVTRENISLMRYWDIDLVSCQKNDLNFEDYLIETEQHIESAVESRLMSDVPLGAFLSGGIDSSLIVAFMHKFVGPGIKTFSIGFNEQKYNELPYAKLVSQKFKTDHYELIIHPEDMLNHIAEAIWYRDEPLAYSSAVPLFLLSKFASRHVKVVLSGEGGDELFAGYPKHVYDRLSKYYQIFPSFVRNYVLMPLISHLSYRFRKVKIAGRCMNIETELKRWTDWFAAFDTEGKAKLLNEKVKNNVQLNSESIYKMYFENLNGASSLSKQLYLDSKVWLPDNLLMKGDKMTMAASIEGRIPLLDHPLVEYAFTIPDHIKLKGLTTKYLLRELAKKYLPQDLTSRRKVGFTVPIGAWFRNEWSQILKKIILSDKALSRGYFRPDAVKQIYQYHIEGRADLQRELWVLFNLEIWNRVFIDNNFIDFNHNINPIVLD